MSTAVLKKATIVGVSVLAASVFLAVPAGAEPGNPCDLAVNFFCQFVPIAPELEGSIDLTQEYPPVDPAAPLPESLPPADICAAGCI